MQRLLRREWAFLGLVGLVGSCAQPLTPDPNLGYVPPPFETPDDSGESLGVEDASGFEPPIWDAGGNEPPVGGDLDAASGQPDADILVDAGIEPDAGPVVDPDPANCTAPSAMCGETCVNLNTSAAHCGACGQACPGNLACDGAGRCKAPQNCSYDLRNGHAYLFCTTKRNWSAARTQCQNFGLDLAIVEDADENTFVTRGESQWMGLTDRDQEGRFRFVVPGGGTRGPEATYLPWGQDEPNNAQSCDAAIFNCTREHCVEVRADGMWNDAQCEKATRAYICESY